MDVSIRQTVPNDAKECGRIIYEAFKNIADQHGFPPDIPNIELGVGVASAFIANPSIFSNVAEIDNKVVGSIFLDKRNYIYGLGPITVDTHMQQKGIGRKLMLAALEHGRNAAGIRLIQDAFNVLSLSLYASLGFEVKELLAFMVGKPKAAPLPEVEVRKLTLEDVEECGELCKKVYGFDRNNEVRDAIAHHSPVIALRQGRITAYATAPTFWPVNHGVAETDEDMYGLLLGANSLTEEPLSFFLPIRQANFYRWCLSQGLQTVSPRTLMAIGEYQEPKGTFFCSVLY